MSNCVLTAPWGLVRLFRRKNEGKQLGHPSHPGKVKETDFPINRPEEMWPRC